MPKTIKTKSVWIRTSGAGTKPAIFEPISMMAATPSPEIIQSSVENWITDHPELSVGVNAKVTNETLTLKESLAVNPSIDYDFNNLSPASYVTPEMYGAVGDGVTDDTQALREAFNSNKIVVLKRGSNYFIMQIEVNVPLVLIGNFATISTRSITAEEYSPGGLKRMLIFNDSASQVYIRDVNFYTTADKEVGGAHSNDPLIPNRSCRTALAGYGVDNFTVINCEFKNFDNPIFGQMHGGDEDTYNHIMTNAYLKDLRLQNTLMGIFGHFRHLNIDGCEVVSDINARSGEHCLYLLTDALDTAIITNSTFRTYDPDPLGQGGDCGSCIQFYPSRLNKVIPTNLKREYRINNCIMLGDTYISNAGGNVYASCCTMKTVNYKVSNNRRQFECTIGNGTVNNGGQIEISNSVVNLEYQDGLTQNIVFKNCNVYSNRLITQNAPRFALYRAYNSQFDNMGIKLANNAKVVDCSFSSSISVVGRYYITAPLNTTSEVINCIFNTGNNVDVIASECVGECKMVSIISPLPIGEYNNIGLKVYNKINYEENSFSSVGNIILYDGEKNISLDTVNYLTINNNSQPLVVGDVFRITWNGIVSVLTAFEWEKNGETTVIIGNPGVVDLESDDNSGLTYYAHNYQNYIAFGTTETGRVKLKVEKLTTEDTSIYGNALFIGDSLCLGYNNENHSFVDILSERGIFSSVTKKAGLGITTNNTTVGYKIKDFVTLAEEIPDATWALADIVYICLQINDAQAESEIGDISDTTNSSISGAITVINNYIRNLNEKCEIVWLTLTRTNWRKISSFTSQIWLKKWSLIAMQKAHALGMREIPFYDIIAINSVKADNWHPNEKGHKLIANLIQQNPYGECDSILVWNKIEPIVLYNGTTTINADSGGGPNYVFLSNISDNMQVGDKYRVVWRNVESILTAKQITFGNETLVIIGNGGATGEGVDDNSGLTYYGFRNTTNTAMIFGTSESTGSLSLKVEKIIDDES